MMWFRIRRFILPYRRFVHFHLFGVRDFERKVPRKGDRLYSCCGTDVKTVEYVSIFKDTIEYTDGSCESIAHCGWHHV